MIQVFKRRRWTNSGRWAGYTTIVRFETGEQFEFEENLNRPLAIAKGHQEMKQLQERQAGE